MQTTPIRQTATATKALEHSSLGKTAFTLTLIGDFFGLFAVLIMAISRDGATPPYFFGAMFWIFVIPSTIMAIMDLNKPNRKKTLPKLALIFGIGIFVIVLLLAIVAMVLFMAIK